MADCCTWVTADQIAALPHTANASSQRTVVILVLEGVPGKGDVAV